MAHDRVRSGTCVNAARTKFVNYRFGNRRPIIAAHVARDNISDKLRQAALRNGLCRLVGRVRKFIDLVNGPSSQPPSLPANSGVPRGLILLSLPIAIAHYSPRSFSSSRTCSIAASF